MVPQAVVSAVGAREEPGQALLQTLCSSLRSKKLLLLLDNCEHLLAACAQLADMLLHCCAELQILISSREGLGIAGEQTFHVPSLSVPTVRKGTSVEHQQPTAEQLSESEAVRLFIDRAQAVVPSFALTNHNATALAQVCYRLDGIPLALELAAARLKVLSVEQLSSRLEDRFRLLTGGSRTALPRQQTLRATIDWSYDLLSTEENLPEGGASKPLKPCALVTLWRSGKCLICWDTWSTSR
jgi:predicted ATPase